MRAHTTLWVAVALVAGFWGATARAGFTSIDTSIVDQGDTAASAVFDPTSASGGLGVTAPASDPQVQNYDVWGTINSDPDLTITEKITNNTSSAWNTYAVTVTPDAGYTVSNLVVDGLPGGATNWLPNSSITGPDVNNAFTITYSGGSVPVGQLLYVVFDFTISDVNGNFSYHIANTPGSGAVPEPASLATVGLGAIILLRRSRRA